MENLIQFDEMAIDWKPLPGPDGEPADHISLSFLNVDEKAKIVDILFKFSANEKILLPICAFSSFSSSFATALAFLLDGPRDDELEAREDRLELPDLRVARVQSGTAIGKRWCTRTGDSKNSLLLLHSPGAGSAAAIAHWPGSNRQNTKLFACAAILKL